jgi:hypothetical protein
VAVVGVVGFTHHNQADQLEWLEPVAVVPVVRPRRALETQAR